MQHTKARRGDAPVALIAAGLALVMAVGAGTFLFARRSATQRQMAEAMRAEEMARSQAAARAQEAARKDHASVGTSKPEWTAPIEKGDASLGRREYSYARASYEEGIVASGVDASSDGDDRLIVSGAHYSLARVLSMMSTGAHLPGDTRTLTAAEAEELRSKAFKMLEKARDLGWKNRAAAEAESDFAPISKDPRWQKLLDSLGH